jgi:hypothetical protein
MLERNQIDFLQVSTDAVSQVARSRSFPAPETPSGWKLTGQIRKSIRSKDEWTEAIANYTPTK